MSVVSLIPYVTPLTVMVLLLKSIPPTRSAGSSIVNVFPPTLTVRIAASTASTRYSGLSANIPRKSSSDTALPFPSFITALLALIISSATVMLLLVILAPETLPLIVSAAGIVSVILSACQGVVEDSPIFA